MKKSCQKNSISLYSVHFPILLAILVISLLGFGAVTKAVSQPQRQAVLSEEEERDSEDSIDEDENEVEDRNDTTHENEDEKDTEDEDKDETENENEVDIEDTDETDEEKAELISTVTNPDGTITKTFRITDEEEVEMKAITYDANGEKIREVELNPDGTTKSEGEDRNDDGEEVEFEYETKAGENTELPNLIEAELEQEISNELGTTVGKVELKVETVNGKYEYEGTTFKDGKLFGIFDVEIPLGIEIDPSTGKILSVNQTFWSKLLDALSF